ncbi:hypothetical protein FACS1894172_12340 [Spirochaetia bacterium]|nr:hypothetical protein FACS1894164_05330 [Spirochaetia bacterium]GHU33563.1 hypothetical protein FACS1894172_12340 [Spirochaetia bacterium]
MADVYEEYLYTYSDYMEWELKEGELIDGIAYEIPAPSTTHQAISRALFIFTGRQFSQMFFLLSRCKILLILPLRG